MCAHFGAENPSGSLRGACHESKRVRQELKGIILGMRDQSQIQERHPSRETLERAYFRIQKSPLGLFWALFKA